MAAIRLVEYNVNGPHKYGIMDSVFGYHIVAVLSSHIFRGNTDRKNPINKLIRYGMAIANILQPGGSIKNNVSFWLLMHPRVPNAHTRPGHQLGTAEINR
jgi:hypothetical protein